MVGDSAMVAKWRNRCCGLKTVSPPTQSIAASLMYYIQSNLFSLSFFLLLLLFLLYFLVVK